MVSPEIGSLLVHLENEGVGDFQGDRLNEKAIRNEVVRGMRANCSDIPVFLK